MTLSKFLIVCHIGFNSVPTKRDLSVDGAINTETDEVVGFSEGIEGRERKVPLVDRQYALQILFELALQRGTITAVIEMVSLLLTLAEKSKSSDNRLVKKRFMLVNFKNS